MVLRTNHATGLAPQDAAHWVGEDSNAHATAINTNTTNIAALGGGSSSGSGPDFYASEYQINPAAFVTAYSNTSATTSISGGVTAADMAAASPNALMAQKVSILGATRAQLELAGLAGYYGPTWLQSSNGQYNYENAGPTTPWGIAYYVANTRYVELLGGLAQSGAVVTYVDGRKLTVNAEAMTGAGSGNNKYKIDLGASNAGVPHRVVHYFHYTFSLAKIFTEANGTIWPYTMLGPTIGFLTDSLGNVDTISPGDHLDFWPPRFCSLAGFVNYFSDVIPGTGVGVIPGGTSFSNFNGRANNANPLANFGLDELICGTWGNDKIQSRTTSQVAADMAALFATINGWTKKPKTIFYGLYDPAGTNGPAYTDYDVVAVTACAAAGVAYVATTTGKVYGYSGTLLATMGPFITTSNRTGLIFSDNLHPTLLGQQYLSRYMYEAYRIIKAAA
jgi:hypothetical protein